MLLNTLEAAQRLHVHERTVRKWCKDGTLRAARIGRDWQIEARDADQLAEKRQIELDEMCARAHARCVAEREKEADNED